MKCHLNHTGAPRILIVGLLALLLGCASASDDDTGSVTAPADIPGVTADTVRIGLVYTSGTAAAGGGIGVSASDPPLARAAQALADEINAGGGILDHTVEIVQAPFDSQVASYAAEFQASCSTLTEDNTVFAAMSEFGPPPVEVLAECLAEHGTVLVMDKTAQSFTQSDWDQWAPYMYAPGAQYIDRIADRLELAGADGYFDGRRVGLISFDTSSVQTLIADEVTPALESMGAEVVAELAYTPGDSSDSVGRTADTMVSAVVQFKDAGVDQVVFAGTGPEAPLTFVAAASAQEFRPAYYFGSEVNPSFQASAAPPGSFSGSRGVGWSPVVDIADTTGSATPGGAACLETIRNAGIDTTGDESNYLGLCDFILFIESAVEAAGSFDAAEIRTSLGEADFAGVYSFEFAPGEGRTDGVSNPRVFDFVDACACFEYASASG